MALIHLGRVGLENYTPERTTGHWLGRLGSRQPVPPPMPVSNKVGEIVVRATVGEVGLAALSGGSRLVGDIEIVSRDILVGEVVLLAELGGQQVGDIVLPFGVGIPVGETEP